MDGVNTSSGVVKYTKDLGSATDNRPTVTNYEIIHISHGERVFTNFLIQYNFDTSFTVVNY